MGGGDVKEPSCIFVYPTELRWQVLMEEKQGDVKSQLNIRHFIFFYSKKLELKLNSVGDLIWFFN